MPLPGNVTDGQATQLSYCIREVPPRGLFLAGQTEPQKIVPRPKKSVSELQEKMVLLSVARFIKHHRWVGVLVSVCVRVCVSMLACG